MHLLLQYVAARRIAERVLARPHRSNVVPCKLVVAHVEVVIEPSAFGRHWPRIREPTFTGTGGCVPEVRQRRRPRGRRAAGLAAPTQCRRFADDFSKRSV